MDIHKPKPVHNWRELAGEIGIIVTGVLIALGAEQIVQSIEWRHKGHAAEEAMRRELSTDDGPQAYARFAARACITDALDRIRAAVESGAPRATIVRLIGNYSTPFWTWDSQAYDAMRSSDLPLHLPAERMAHWTNAYVLMGALNTANAKEYNDGAGLAALAHIGGPLTPAERQAVLTAVETLRRDAGTMTIAVRISLPAMYATGVRLSPGIRDRAMATTRKAYGNQCLQAPPEPPAQSNK